MRLLSALILAVFSIASPALAQTSSRDMKGGTTEQQQPGMRAKPAEPAAPATNAAPAVEKVDPAKEAAIRHLMDITDTSKMGESISTDIISSVQSVMSRTVSGDRLQKFMTTFSQKFSEAAPASKVNDNTAAVYAKHFSMEDIQGLTKFYESPLGQRVLKLLPEAQQEAYSSSRQMDQQAAVQVLRGMSDEYTELKQMLPPDPSKPETKPAGAPTPAPGAAPAPKPATAPAAGTAPAPSPKTAPAPPQN